VAAATLSFTASATGAVDWSGLYVGVQGGYAFGCSDPCFVGTKTRGGFLGIHAGYNWHSRSNWVFGVEADISNADVGDAYVNKFNYFFTARTRLGYAHNAMLFYVTGGVAWGSEQLSDIETLLGYTIGAGLEWQFAPKWSARIEYQFFDFSRTGFRSAFGEDISAIKVGLSYRFDQVAATPQLPGLFTWSGYYAGIHGGYGTNSGIEGWFTGFQAGRNWQLTPITLVGLEADFAVGDIGNANAVSSVNFAFIGTVRARAGFVVDQKALIYGTGGLAFGQNDFIVNGLGSDQQLHFGFALGAGIEWALNSNWSAKLEYLHFELSGSYYTIAGISVASPNLQFTTVKTGLNYRF
jgi:outer membrane immunogenic protein